MRGETLLAGFILRVAVKRNRWHITLHNLKTGEVRPFSSFAALITYLEQTSSKLTQPPWNS